MKTKLNDKCKGENLCDGSRQRPTIILIGPTILRFKVSLQLKIPFMEMKQNLETNTVNNHASVQFQSKYVHKVKM